ncbi:hypothetical protein JMUB7543_28380 [Staphylococcus aureus]
MIRRPQRSTPSNSSAASDVYKRQGIRDSPIRDLTKYLKVADKEGFTITKAAETHIHADFASGIRDVANKLNASIYCLLYTSPSPRD